MVDPERLHRILRRVSDDLAALEDYAAKDSKAVLEDPAWLGHTKYLFVCVLEGSVDAAQHVCASEGWGPPDTNADTFRFLARHKAIDSSLAEKMAAASGFPNLLVHRYAAIDDELVVRHLQELPTLRRYVEAMSALLQENELTSDGQASPACRSRHREGSSSAARRVSSYLYLFNGDGYLAQR